MTVLSTAGIAGVFLAVLGWSQRGNGVITPTVTGSPPAATSPASPGAAGTAAPGNSPAAAGPSAGASPSAAASPSASAGPALSSLPYASYAYLVWPKPLTAEDKLALSGFVLNVTRQAGGISVQATQDGQRMTSVSHFYPGGAKVYILDSDLSDDGGGNVDYNDTDDGLIVTNAQGQVLP